MPARESLRPVTNADVDEYVRTRATEGMRAARAGGRAPIVDSDISWDDVPVRRSRRRHPVAAADDWGLAESDAWSVEPRPASERPSSTRDQAGGDRSAQAARAELASDWEAEHQSSDGWVAWEPEHRSTGDWVPGESSVPFDQNGRCGRRRSPLSRILVRSSATVRSARHESIIPPMTPHALLRRPMTSGERVRGCPKNAARSSSPVAAPRASSLAGVDGTRACRSTSGRASSPTASRCGLCCLV